VILKVYLVWEAINNMAGIDYTIPGQFKGIQLESPMNAMAQAMQLRGLQEASQLNALRAQEYELKTQDAREMSRQRNALAQYLANPKKPTDALELEAGVRQVAPLLADQFVDTQLKRADLGIRTKEHEAKTFEIKTKEEERKRAMSKEQFQDAVGDLVSYDTVDHVLAALEQKLNAGQITQAQKDQVIAGLPNNDSEIPAWQIRTLRGLLTPKERVEDIRAEAKISRDEGKPMVVEGNLVSPTGQVIYEGERKPVPVAPGGQLVNPKTGEVIFSADAAEAKPISVAPGGQLVNPKTGEVIFVAPAAAPAPTPAQRDYQAAVDAGFKGSFTEFLDQQKETEMEREWRRAKAEGYKGSFLDWKKANKQATNISVNNPAAITPVTIVDPNNPDRAIVVNGRDGRVIGQAIKEPSGVQLSAKEKQNREAKYPQATAAVKTYETKSEQLAKDLETLANHPGLDGISGAIYGRLPSGTRDSMAAQEKYNAIVARGGFTELADMRASSPTGGALGNVSNQEGQYLRDAFASIGRTQSRDDLKAALIEAAKRVRESKGRIREAYDMTYEYRDGGQTTPAAPKSDIQNKADAVLRGAK
jgi:hypothetical protein